MKLNILFVAFIGILFMASCNSDKQKEQANDATITVEMEEKLAKEANEESQIAKQEAEKVEQEVDKLLEDI